MLKSLNECTPQEMLALKASELKEAIRLSEGRVVTTLSRVRGPNYLQYVTNAEVCAAFGSDILYLDTYNPRKPYFPGLVSKNPEDDEPFRDVQIQIGKGWTAREIRALVGRPLSASMMFDPPSYGGHTIDTGYADSQERNVAGLPMTTWDDFELAIDQGFDIIHMGGWGEPKQYCETTRDMVKRAAGRVIIHSGIPHGPGLIYAKDEPYNIRNLLTPDFAKALADTGADIIDVPAAGSLPGFTVEYVRTLADIIHKAGALVNVGIHNSQEGTDVETIKRIAIDNRTAGADMCMLGDAGVNENVALPDVLNSVCVAVKGKQYTYRRMCQSVLR